MKYHTILGSLFLVGFSSCTKDGTAASNSAEVTPTQTQSRRLEEPDLEAKLSKLSTSLEKLADTLRKNADKGSTQAKENLATIESELAEVGQKVRHSASDSEKATKEALGRVVDEIDTLVKRMNDSLD